MCPQAFGINTEFLFSVLVQEIPIMNIRNMLFDTAKINRQYLATEIKPASAQVHVGLIPLLLAVVNIQMLSGPQLKVKLSNNLS